MKRKRRAPARAGPAIMTWHFFERMVDGSLRASPRCVASRTGTRHMKLTPAVRPYLKSVFGRVQEDFELLNIPPARLFYCAR